MEKNRTQRRDLEVGLATLKRQLVQELRRKLQQCTVSSTHHSTELLDLASDSQLDDMTARIAEADSVKIDEIEEALQLLREGHYGVCLSCGRKISKRRLRAIPFATLCLKCKVQKEKEQLGVPSEVVPHHGGRGGVILEFDVSDNHRDEEDPGLPDLFKDIQAGNLY